MVRRPVRLTGARAPRSAYLIGVLSLAVGLAACGSGHPKLPTVLTAAPEPATAPPPAGTPAGRVVTLSQQAPEGIVVDAGSRYAVVATRIVDDKTDRGAIALVDLTTLQIVRSVPVGAARHLELTTDGEQVIVPSEPDDLLSVLAIPSLTTVSSVKVGRQPHDAAQVGPYIVVADELGGAVTATEGDQNLSTIGGFAQPGGVAAAGGRAGVVDVRARLLDVFSVGPLALVGQVPVGAGPTHAVGLGDGIIAVADTTGGEVYLVRVTGTPAVVASFPVPDQPYGLAVDLARHRLWVASSGDDTLREYVLGDPGTVPKIGPTYLTVQQPNSLAVVPDTGAVLVAGATPVGQLQEITP